VGRDRSSGGRPTPRLRVAARSTRSSCSTTIAASCNATGMRLTRQLPTLRATRRSRSPFAGHTCDAASSISPKAAPLRSPARLSSASPPNLPRPTTGLFVLTASVQGACRSLSGHRWARQLNSLRRVGTCLYAFLTRYLALLRRGFFFGGERGETTRRACGAGKSSSRGTSMNHILVSVHLWT
jgi:hypothetical protein